MNRRPPWILALTLVLVGSVPAFGQNGSPGSETEELVRQEKIRFAVEVAIESYLQSRSADERLDTAVNGIESLQAFGADAVPYLVNELEQELQLTYDFCAYALGHLPSPASEQALRLAMERAENSSGEFARVRKAWAAWSLGLLGKADVIDRLDRGKHLVSSYPMHADTSLAEAVALQTAPDSVPLLLAELERASKDEALRPRRSSTLRALRRIGDSRAISAVSRVLDEDPDRSIRREAARTLGAMRAPEAAAALLGALGDEDFSVRQRVALSLSEMRADLSLRDLSKLLEEEWDAQTRGQLYVLLARTGESRAFSVLRSNWGRPDPKDRRLLVEALALLDSRKALDLLAKAMGDEDNSVAVRAVLKLGAIASEPAVDRMIAAIETADITVLQMIVDELRRLEAARAAPAIAKRLIDRELAVVVEDRRVKVPAFKMADALVSLGYHEALPRFREALARQKNTGLIHLLQTTIPKMEALARNGNELERWIATARGADRELRLLAYARLGRIGGSVAAKALVEAYPGAEPEGKLEILRSIGEVDAPGATELIVRVLEDPEIDSSSSARLREMAAWAARRIGGPTMFELLTNVVERHSARDARVLIYAVLTGGRDALPLLEAHRVKRMRYLGWMRGRELEKLDWLREEIAAGRSVAAVDAPPEHLSFR